MGTPAAGAALNAAIGFDEYQSRLLVSMHGSGEARVYAWGRIAVAAADGETLESVLFNPDAAGGGAVLCFSDLSGSSLPAWCASQKTRQSPHAMQRSSFTRTLVAIEHPTGAAVMVSGRRQPIAA
jgi:hypothetical protein